MQHVQRLLQAGHSAVQLELERLALWLAYPLRIGSFDDQRQ